MEQAIAQPITIEQEALLLKQTIKGLQSHILKYILTSAIAVFAVVGLASLKFYYTTNDGIEVIKQQTDENTKDIKNVNTKVTDIQNSLTANGVNTIDSKERIQSFDARISNIEATQTKIFEMLVDIKNSKR